MLKTPAFWAQRGPLSTALLPVSALYGAGAALRRAWAAPQAAGVPVICVGNLVAGGAGKTPVALLLAEMLGAGAWFLSRGYGGVLSGPVRVELSRHSAADVGDEPLLLAACAPTVVARDRLEGARFAVRQGAELLIMDDGFQNPRLRKDLSLLVVDGEYGFGNGRLLPAGPLREPVAPGLARADGVIVIGGECMLPGALRARLVPEQAEGLRGKRVLGFAGIGRPEKFHRTLEALGCALAGFVPFADHHAYSEADMQRLHRTAPEAQLVTTAKDAVRLPPAWRERVAVVRVRLELERPEALRALLATVRP